MKAGETGNVSFTFDVTDKYTVLACRMVAEGDTFSDGEQRYIPVLTDKQWVTESGAVGCKRQRKLYLLIGASV